MTSDFPKFTREEEVVVTPVNDVVSVTRVDSKCPDVAVSRLRLEIDNFFQRHALKPGHGIVAVSGGADSVALLRGLILARRGQPLIVAHFNHQLRGAASDADAAFVRKLADGWGLPFHVGSADVAAIAAQTHGNLEATARKLRYDWLMQVAVETGAKWVATGHTADDQAETILHRLIRGTGLQGLRGIAAKRALNERGLLLVRPILTVTRADVVAFLHDQNVPHSEDTTNADLAFTRNRIRAELLPLLKTFNPEVVAVLARLSEQAEEAYSEQAEAAASLLQQAEKPRAGPFVILDRPTLIAAPRDLLRAMFRQIWARENWPQRNMDHHAWDRTTAIVHNESHNHHFPGNIAIHATRNVVRVGPHP